MAIEFQCPRCQTEFNVSDEDAGTKQRCPHCQAKVRVPASQTPAGAKPAGGAAMNETPWRHCPATGAATIEFICPRCQTAMQARALEAGSKQRCPQCQAKVRVPAPVEAPAPRVTIEFQCPRCKEVIRARGDEVGNKQFCPRCSGKVRVPTPSGSWPRARRPTLCDELAGPDHPFPTRPFRTHRASNRWQH